MLGFVFWKNHLLRVGKKGTKDKTEQTEISEDNLPIMRKLPDKAGANDGWNSEDNCDSCFSFRFHFVTP